MTSLFCRLPPELSDNIASFLDVASLRSLRLVSRLTKAIFTPAFLLYLEAPRVDLSETALRRLCDLASAPHCAAAVRRLDLVCLYYYDHDETKKERTGFDDVYKRLSFSIRPDVERTLEATSRQTWIKQRKAEQAAFPGKQMFDMLTTAMRAFRNLRCVTLEQSVVIDARRRRGPEFVQSLGWRYMWSRAIQAYHILMAALSHAQPSLDRLEILQKTKKCSIPVDELVPFLADSAGLAAVAGKLKHFSISTATTVHPSRPRLKGLDMYEPFDISGGQMLSHGDDIARSANFAALVDLLRLMPGLESLHIHLFSTVRATICGFAGMMDLLSSELHFPALTDLTLRGLPARQEALQSLIRKHSTLRKIRLEHIVLTTGVWDEVFSTIAWDAPLVESFYIGALRNGPLFALLFNVVAADPPPDNPVDQLSVILTSLRESGCYSSLSTKFCADQVRRGLQLQSMVGGMSDWKGYNWNFLALAEYGPPV